MPPAARKPDQAAAYGRQRRTAGLSGLFAKQIPGSRLKY